MNYAALTMVGTAVTLASCNSDTTDPINLPGNQAPNIDILSFDDGSSVDGDVITGLNPGQLYPFILEADDAEENLRDITVQINGTVATAGGTDIFTGPEETGVNTLPSGKYTVAGTDVVGNYRDTLYLRSAVSGDSVVYTFIATDDENEESTEATVTLRSANALTDSTRNAILYNASGPQNGAFDLDTYQSVASNDTTAELQDAGIDLESAGTPWRKTISAEGGATIRSLSVEDATSFTYGSVQSADRIRELYDNSEDAEENRVGPVETDDNFIVNKGNKYWLINVAAVTEDPNGNRDSYSLNIKSGQSN